MRVIQFFILLLIVNALASCKGCSSAGRQQLIEQAEASERNDHREQTNELQTEEEPKVTEQDLALPENKASEVDPEFVEELSDQYERLKRSVFTVFCLRDENLGEYSQGTGFVIGSSGICLSNAHVFENGINCSVQLDAGEAIAIEEILEINHEQDYVIFRIALHHVERVEIAQNNPKVGEEVFAIGSPRGLDHTLSTGIVSNIHENGRIIQTTTSITHGSSGGPLFNRYGEAIGITSSGYGEANLNFAISLQQIPWEKYLRY